MKDFEPGDIFACWHPSLLGRSVSLATSSLLCSPRWAPCHVAIAADYTYPGRTDGKRDLLWYESTSLSPRPCAILGEMVSGIQGHYPKDRISDYLNDGGRVAVYRLSPPRAAVIDDDVLSWFCEHHLGKKTPYDSFGAAMSGTRLFQMSRLFPAADDKFLFCSEFIAEALQLLGVMCPGENSTRFNPGRLIRSLLWSGNYSYVGEAEA